MDHLSRSISRSKTAKTILAFSEAAAAEAGTDLIGLAKQVGEHIQSPACTPSQHFKLVRMLWQMHLIADAADRAERDRPAVPPETMVRKMHANGQLVAALRRLLDDGTVTLDDVDPPPA